MVARLDGGDGAAAFLPESGASGSATGVELVMDGGREL